MARELALLCTQLRDQPSVLWPVGFFRLDGVAYLEYPLLSAVVAGQACFNLYEYMQARRLSLPDPSKAETVAEKLAMQVATAVALDDTERALFRQVLFSLKLLHDAGFVHGNVKPQNFLVSDAPLDGAETASLDVPRVVLSDFVSTRAEPPPSPAPAVMAPHGALPPPVLRHSSVAVEMDESNRFAAPEVRVEGEPSRRPSDVWSAGMVLFECVHGNELANAHAPAFDTLLGELPIDVPRTDGAFDELLTAMTQYEPGVRPSAAACEQHAFFSQTALGHATLEGLDFDSPARIADMLAQDSWETRGRFREDDVMVPPGQQLPVALRLLAEMLDDPDSVASRWHIRNEGQEGQDAGGLLSEFHFDVWTHLVSGKPPVGEEIGTASEHFEPAGGDFSLPMANEDLDPDTKTDVLQTLRKAGALVVKTMFDRLHVSAALGGAVFKYLHAGDKAVGSMADLREFNPWMASKLAALLALPASSWARSYEEYVAVAYNPGVEPEGGQPTDVTKADFVRREIQWQLFDSRSESLEAMREGFVIVKRGLEPTDQARLRDLSHRELRYVAQGDLQPTVAMVLSICDFRRLESDDDVVWAERARWLRESIAGFSEEQLRQLLKFALNVKTAPLPHHRIRFARLTSVPSASEGYIVANATHLPHTHTCFGQIDIPPYTSAEQLDAKLKYAIPFGYGHQYA